MIKQTLETAVWSGGPSYYTRLDPRTIQEESQADEKTLDVGWSRDVRTDVLVDDLIDESFDVDWS